MSAPCSAATVAAERLKIVATLIRRTGDWGSPRTRAERAAARALSAHAAPRHPGQAGALTTAARNAAIDALRRAAAEHRTVGQATVEAIVDLEEERSRMLDRRNGCHAAQALDDDRLRLIFTCCHPALAHRGPRRADAAHRGRHGGR